MKRRILALIICLVMTVIVLAGCGGPKADKTGDTTSTDGTGNTATEGAKDGGSDSETAGEPYEVVMTFPTLGNTPADLQLVEDAVNAITVPEVNVKVKLYPISLFDLTTQSNLMIANNEKLDLLLIFSPIGPISDYVNKGMLIPLDELVNQYGQDITAAEGKAMAGGYVDGALYAVPSEEKMGRQYGFAFRTDMLEKYGYDYGKDLITYEQLDEMFAKIKAGEGKDFYMLALQAGSTGTFGSMNLVDTLGASSATGVLMNGGLDNTMIVNLYETEEYKEHLKWMRKWYQAGYINPDVLTNTEASTILVQSGKYLGGISSTEADMKFNLSKDCAQDMTMVNMTLPSATTGMYQTSVWSIPITCENPEATMKLLNLTYKSQELINLLKYGVEGTHYEKTDDTGIIKYPDGINAGTVGYLQPLGVFGDKSKMYQMLPATSAYFDDLKAFNASITEDKSSKALGYSFNTKNVKTEKAAIDSVISQYTAALEFGAVDPEETLPEFINALKAAGIEKVTAENQKMLDEWLAQK